MIMELADNDKIMFQLSQYIDESISIHYQSKNVPGSHRNNISARDNSWVDGLHAGAEPEGGEGGHLPPLTPKISLHI